MDQPQNPSQHNPLKPGESPATPETPASPADGVPEGPPLSPMGWLINNGVYIVLFLAIIVSLYRNYGLDGLWRAALVVLGLSFVIFIHELGHFVAAKWCDVHVTTFSLGFGPALPGCSFVRGETTYKIALLPLGGYVAMIGEGGEADEDESYPRSFKNKTVGQRMLIISAGVIMNVLLGMLCFIFVFLTNGIERPVATVWVEEAGSPAWVKGVRTGWDLAKIDDQEKPFFDDMKLKVLVSDAGQQIPFTFVPHGGGEPVTIDIEPRRDYSDIAPVIGIASGIRLELFPHRAKRDHEIPAYYDSAAAAARVVDFQPGDEVLTSRVEAWTGDTDPNSWFYHTPTGVDDLCRLFRAYPDRPIQVRVRRKGETEPVTVVLAPKGFEFNDQITATTNDKTPREPFNILDLPDDPSNEVDRVGDPYEYRRRLRVLAGKPIVMKVKNGDATRLVLVPPEYHRVLPGLRMKMGEVAAVRDNSPASKAGFITGTPGNKGDVITRVEVIRTNRDNKEVRVVFENVQATKGNPVAEPVRELDPLRLPFDLVALARADERDRAKPMRIKITVARLDRVTHKDAQRAELKEIEWDESWDEQEDLPLAAVSPMAISQLGLAFRVESIIDHVVPGSPADRAGLKENDGIEKIAYQQGGKTRAEKPTWSQTFSLETERTYDKKAFDAWAHVAYLYQRQDASGLRFTVRRGDKVLDKPIEMETVRDETWATADSRGLLFLLDRRRQKADNLVSAIYAGTSETLRFIKLMYLNLRSLFTGRISTKTLGGPIEIAAQTFTMAEDPYLLVLWLGMISVNLAVVNFLPIPILDGGHMVFLIYEWLRGRPPSQAVQAAATYVGLFLILSLMIFVIYIDVRRRFPGLF